LQDHTISAPVEFDIVIRNDKGRESFRVLANIYDSEGTEVAHLVHEPLLQLNVGDTTTVTFRWRSASKLGAHTIGIEFYAADWESWTLKYPEVEDFFVRNRGASTDGQTTDGQTTDGQTTDGQTTDGESSDANAGKKSSGCTITSENESLLWIMALCSALALMRRRLAKSSVLN